MSPRIIRILWIIFFICLLPAIVTLEHRNEFDREFKKVALVADYRQLLQLAQTEKVSIEQILARVRDEAGVQRVALLEDTPVFLAQRGLCTIVEGVGWPGWKTPEERDAIERNRGREPREATPPSADWPLLLGLRHDMTHLIFSDTDIFERVATAAELRYSGLVEWEFLDDGGGILSLAGEPKITLEWGLGFDRGLVLELRSRGFTVYPRLKNYPGLSLDSVEMIITETSKLFPGAWLIPDGDSVLPLTRLENLEFAKKGDDKLAGVGWIEFAEQRNAKEIAMRYPTFTARVHSIEDEEMEVITPDRAIARFTRAVRERTVRIVYLKPFLLQVDRENRVEKTIGMFKGVRDSLLNAGFTIGEPSSVRSILRAHMLTQIAAILALGIAFILLLRTLGIQVSNVLGILILLILFAFCFISGFTGIKLAALGLATVVPTLAIAWLTHKYDSVYEKVHSGKMKAIAGAIGLWLAASGITITGALIVAACLVETRTLLAIDTFSGVKLALYLPILLAVIIGVQLIVPKEKRTLKGGLEWLLSTEVRIWHVILGLFALVALFIMIDRSGNFPVVSVADWENKIRGWFEVMLYARPRTKEIFAGHPGLLIGIYLGLSSLKIRRTLMYAGLVVGAIALTSMTNTFCHIHTPLVLSIYRTIAGMIIGGAVGIVVSWVVLVVLGVVQKRRIND